MFRLCDDRIDGSTEEIRARLEGGDEDRDQWLVHAVRRVYSPYAY